jgi:hypothetical protein
MGNGSDTDLLGPFLVYDAEESEEARITSQGLDGPWLVIVSAWKMQNASRKLPPQ